MKYICERCKSENTEIEVWEDEYAKYFNFTCLDCGYVVGKFYIKKMKEELENER